MSGRVFELTAREIALLRSALAVLCGSGNGAKPPGWYDDLTHGELRAELLTIAARLAADDGSMEDA
jgi:hypothetical protein